MRSGDKMKCEFYVGQKVMCINAKSQGYATGPLDPTLTEGKTYTILSMYPDAECQAPEDIGLELYETSRKPCPACGRVVPYRHTRFRALAARKTDISALTGILRTAKAPTDDDPYEEGPTKVREPETEDA